QRELGLEPVGVVFLVAQHLLEQVAGAVVAETAAELDGRVQGLHRALFHLEVEAELLGHGLADVDLAEPLEVGHALEIEDALDERVGVLHLLDRFRAHLLLEPLVAPVLAHARVDEVLVHRRELGGEDIVERGDDLVGALHGRAPAPTDAASFSARMSISMSVQAPQSPPAPQALVTASGVPAPRSITRRMSLSETPRQRQTITTGLLPTAARRWSPAPRREG